MKLIRAVLAAIMAISVTAAHAQVGEEALRVTAMGTSLTARGGWTTPLAELLSKCLQRPVTMQVIAKAGENSSWALGQLDALRMSQADVLLVEFAINDAAMNDGIPLSGSRSNISAIVTAARGANPDVRVFLISMSPATGLKAWMRPWLDHYYDEYQILATAMDLNFIDLRPFWSALSSQELDQVMPDGLHPRPEFVSPLIILPIASAINGQPCHVANY